MDLNGWNSDFDSSFMNYWDDAGDTNSRNDNAESSSNKGEKQSERGNRSLSSARSSPRDDPSLWDGGMNQWSQISNFDYETNATASERSYSKACSEPDQEVPMSRQHQQQQHQEPPSGAARMPQAQSTDGGGSGFDPVQISATTSVASIHGTRGDGASTTTDNTSVASNNAASALPNNTGLHPLAIQSSATCPPHGTSHSMPKTNTAETTNHFSHDQQHHNHQQSSMTLQQPHHHQMPPTAHGAMTLPQPLAYGLQQHLAQNLYGFTAGLDASSMASLAASLQEHSTNHSLTPETSLHLSSLAANFMLAQGGMVNHNNMMPTQQVHGHTPTTFPSAAATHHQQQQLPNAATSPAVAASQQRPNSSQVAVTAPKAAAAAASSTGKNTTSKGSSRNQTGTTKQAKGANDNSATTAGSGAGNATSSSTSNTSTARDGKKKAPTRQKQQQQQQPAPHAIPPFYLFDAPIELRANYQQNQRRLGIPVEEDCNSYHYGETVKGFHPQNLLEPSSSSSGSTTHQGQNPPSNGGGASSSSLSGNILPAPVQLVDARHGNPRQPMIGRVKNEREQKRAQKITDLIEQLRLNMETGGWKVEMRSKFHTLSSCAEYVKHMMKTIKEKEEKTKKLQEEIEVKQKKIAEDKSVQESRSDPESVTSSLTSSTGGSHSQLKAEESRKRKTPPGEDTSCSNKKRSDSNSRNVSSYATCEDSSGDDRGSGGPFNSVSDITDSNRGSSSNSSGSGGSGSGGSDPTVTRDAAEDEEQPSGSSISSDAAVRSERSSHVNHGGSRRKHHKSHKDVVFSEKKGPPDSKNEKSKEINSLHRSFELDYEEVFDKSNIPQIIASTAGKVVAWNEVFIKVSGLRKSEVERMTIFSLVQPNKLSNFFQIVAAALKSEGEESSSRSTGDAHRQGTKKDGSNLGISSTAMEVDPSTRDAIDSGKDETSSDSSQQNESVKDSRDFKRTQNYTAITLPCIDFPAMKKRRENRDTPLNTKPLHVTVTLMDDEDPSKRFFHCVFTNCKGTDGSLGLLTPELLEALFTEPDVKIKKNKSHHRHHKSKRPRTRETDALRDEERLDGNKIDKIIPIPRKAAMPGGQGNTDQEQQNEVAGDEEMKDVSSSQDTKTDSDLAETTTVEV